MLLAIHALILYLGLHCMKEAAAILMTNQPVAYDRERSCLPSCIMSTQMTSVPIHDKWKRHSSCSGCHLHDKCLNSPNYADDMVLLAPTVDALQDVISVRVVIGARHEVVYNVIKTVA